MPWRTARPLRGPDEADVAGRDLEAGPRSGPRRGRRARSSTASLARRSAPAAPAEAYSGSEPPSPTWAGRGSRVVSCGSGIVLSLGALRDGYRRLMPADCRRGRRHGPRRRRHASGAGYDRASGPAQSLRHGARRARRARRGERASPPFRARQVYGWLYHRRVRDVGGDGQPAEAAARGARRAPSSCAGPRSRSDALLRRHAQVPLPPRGRGRRSRPSTSPRTTAATICISTQAGCPLKCAFCLTGIAGYKRNLKAGEILGQVATVMEEHPVSATHPHRRGEDPFPWNVVVMGMGEPLLNYDATVEALRILMDEEGFGVPPRKLTLSTVGILPALEKLAQEPVRPNLAISLHAPDPGLRRALMPIEEKYPFDEVVDAALRYPIPRGGLVTFEYVLLGGVNDTVAHAREPRAAASAASA
ncbi:MAG: radical SAM protein [Comamonadaceae bacterium]|nr:radical SAM protein [Comamonadaceae bacterium]